MYCTGKIICQQPSKKIKIKNRRSVESVIFSPRLRCSHEGTGKNVCSVKKNLSLTRVEDERGCFFFVVTAFYIPSSLE